MGRALRNLTSCSSLAPMYLYGVIRLIIEAHRQQPIGHVGHVLPSREDGRDLAAAALLPNGLDEVGEDGDEINDLSGHVTGRGLVVHDVQHAEGVEDDGEAVVVDNEQPVLVAVDEDL